MDRVLWSVDAALRAPGEVCDPQASFASSMRCWEASARRTGLPQFPQYLATKDHLDGLILSTERPTLLRPFPLLCWP
jgi:hypothetical protein